MQKNQIQVRKIRDIRLAKATLAIIAFCNLHQVLIFTLFFQFHTSILTLRLESDQVLHSSTHFPMPFFHWSLSTKGSQRVLKAVFFWPSFVTSPSLLCHYYPGQNCMTSLVPQEYQRQESCFGAFTMTPIQSQGRSSVGKCYSVIIVKWITKTKKI